jgi:hypothetical protein
MKNGTEVRAEVRKVRMEGGKEATKSIYEVMKSGKSERWYRHQESWRET